MTEVKRDDFIAWYGHQAVDAARLGASGAPAAANLAAADADRNGEITRDARNDELSTLFDRLKALDPGARANAFDTERDGRATPAGEAFDLVAIHMRQKTGADEAALGARTLAEVPSLAAILDGRPGAKLRRVDGRATLGTGPMQDALNVIAAKEEAARGGGYRSPVRVDFGRYRGYFGGATETAVKAFQRSVPLPDTGVVDRRTLDALETSLAAARGVVAPNPGGDGAVALASRRFANSETYRSIAAGRATLAPGSANKAAIEVLQVTLYSLGYDIGRAWVDRDFGRSTKGALEAFQGDAGVAVTGVVDRDTLAKLDQRAEAQVAELRAITKPLGSKKDAFRLVADLAPNRTTRVYVIDRANGEPIARYLTSPGKAGHETLGNRFTIRRVLPRATWYPPQSDWARNLQPVPPGLDNPMGILKLDFGQYAQYLHGIPHRAVVDLGKPASHGCLRMSPTNILELYESFAEAGTDVRINRDAAESARLDAAFAATGKEERPTAAGREWIAGYVAGDLGRREALANGQPVIA